MAMTSDGNLFFPHWSPNKSLERSLCDNMNHKFVYLTETGRLEKLLYRHDEGKDEF